MVTLNSEAAQRKWDSLAKTESATLERIVSGNASSDDYDRLTFVLGQYSHIAKDVFSRGIKLLDREVAKESEKIIIEKQVEPSSEQADSIREEIRTEIFTQKITELLDSVQELVDASSRPEDTTNSYTEPELAPAVFRQDNDDSDDEPSEFRKKPNSEALFRDIDSFLGSDVSATTSDTNIVPVSIDSIDDDVLDKMQNDDKPNWPKEWWRQFRLYVGGKASRATGIMKELATLAALTYAFSPKVREWVNDKVSDLGKFLKIDVIKQVLADTWVYIKQQGSNLIDWFLDKLKEASAWASNQLEGIKDFASNSYTSTKNWITETVENPNLRRHEVMAAWYNKDVDFYQNRLNKLRDTSKNINPGDAARQAQHDRQMQQVERMLNQARKDRQHHLNELEGIKRQLGTVEPSNDVVHGGATGSWQQATATPTGVDNPPMGNPGGTSTTSTSLGVSTTTNNIQDSAATKEGATSVQPPPVLDIADSAAPPQYPSDVIDQGIKGPTSVQSQMPTLDSFSYAPQVSDRLTLANFLT